MYHIVGVLKSKDFVSVALVTSRHFHGSHYGDEDENGENKVVVGEQWADAADDGAYGNRESQRVGQTFSRVVHHGCSLIRASLPRSSKVYPSLNQSK